EVPHQCVARQTQTDPMTRQDMVTIHTPSGRLRCPVERPAQLEEVRVQMERILRPHDLLTRDQVRTHRPLPPFAPKGLKLPFHSPGCFTFGQPWSSTSWIGSRSSKSFMSVNFSRTGATKALRGRTGAASATSPARAGALVGLMISSFSSAA